MFTETQGQCVNTSKVYVRVKDTSSYFISRALVILLKLKIITGYVHHFLMRRKLSCTLCLFHEGKKTYKYFKATFWPLLPS